MFSKNVVLYFIVIAQLFCSCNGAIKSQISEAREAIGSTYIVLKDGTKQNKSDEEIKAMMTSKGKTSKYWKFNFDRTDVVAVQSSEAYYVFVKAEYTTDYNKILESGFVPRCKKGKVNVYFDEYKHTEGVLNSDPNVRRGMNYDRVDVRSRYLVDDPSGNGVMYEITSKMFKNLESMEAIDYSKLRNSKMSNTYILNRAPNKKK
jgi:hypothetical protein